MPETLAFAVVTVRFGLCSLELQSIPTFTTAKRKGITTIACRPCGAREVNAVAKTVQSWQQSRSPRLGASLRRSGARGAQRRRRAGEV
eukprot:5258460-Pleurochrysis_carterae.AAC.1